MRKKHRKKCNFFSYLLVRPQTKKPQELEKIEIEIETSLPANVENHRFPEQYSIPKDAKLIETTISSNLEKDSDFHDLGLGSIMGALIGDATGSYLEFGTKQLNDENLKKAISMNYADGPH